MHGFEYQTLFQFIESHTGLKLDERRQKQIRELLDSSLEKTPVDKLIQLLRQVDYQHELWQAFLRIITVGETYFFRNQAHMKALRYHVLPRIIEERRRSGYKQLRLWSAGCATGEEPYTLAMLLDELLPDLDSWSISILATDINATYLEYARKGIYQQRSFRLETPDYVKLRWFEEQKDGQHISPRIRKLVNFQSLNLVLETYPSPVHGISNMDLILCRNVTIYFELDTTRAIMDRLYRTLQPTGWLVIGHSEPQIGVYDAFVTHNFENAILYQKPIEVLLDSIPTPIITTPSWQKTVSTPRAAPRKDHESQVQKWLNKKPETRVEPRQNRTSRVSERPSRKIIGGATDQDQKSLWDKAWLAANQEKWEETLKILDDMNRQDKFQAQVHYLYALVYQQQDQDEKALRSLKQALYCDQNFALGHYSIGELYARRKQGKEALHHWHVASKLVEDLAPDYLLPYTYDLTVEMLRDLIKYQLTQWR